jgi:hypothetical protein
LFGKPGKVLIVYLLKEHYMFNFVLDYPESELSKYVKIDSIEKLVQTNAIEASEILSRGDLTWCLQTYLKLIRSTSLNLRCSNQLCEDSINIVHSDTLLNIQGNRKHFIVCVQADYPRRPWSHYHIVQNKSQVFIHTSYIPHWPQPGIVKRDASRQGVLRVAYAGQVINNNLAGSEGDWKRKLKPFGVEFVTLSKEMWHHLKDIDVLLGIRTFNGNSHNSKPPSKLLNAWRAEIPFIGGNDSAFKQIGHPGKDYLIAKTQPDALKAILRLRDEPELYKRIVENGKRMALNYTEDIISKIWEDVFLNRIMKRYELWKKRSQFEWARFNLIQKYGLLEHNSKQLIKRLIA